MIASVYDLIDSHGYDAVLEWITGGKPDGFDRLGDDELDELLRCWPFWARPGQRWEPGPETITYYSAGRGFGKSLVLANILGEASQDPDRWAGEAMLIGITPADLISTNIQNDTGILRVCETYGYARPQVRLSPPYSLTFPAPRGGGRGLHVRLASSNKPEGTRGPNIGLLLADEFAFFADVKDDNGYTAWESAMNALRAGDEKAVIVSSPSRKASVVEMRKAAEEPMCSDRTVIGDDGQVTMIKGCGEKLPPSARLPISHLFSATTTEATRVCPKCGETVVAKVRLIRASTLDNAAHLAEGYKQRVREALDGGSKHALRELAGEILEDDGTAPIASIKEHDLGGLRAERDPWATLLAAQGIRRVVVAVDPAVTAGENACDSGLVALGQQAPDQGRPGPVLGLQDWSVGPKEVEGSPSRVWAPRSAVLAALWGAEAIVVEINQGGLEVLDPARRALQAVAAEVWHDGPPHTPPRGFQGPGTPAGAVTLRSLVSDRQTFLRAQAAARRCRVEGVHRRADKRARWDWASGYVDRGDLALVRAPWLPREHWQACKAHLTRYVPASDSRSKDPIDRGDTLISGAQWLLGVQEKGEGARVVDPATSPVYQGGSLF